MTHTDLIPLDSIDKVPIAMIAAKNDSTCPYDTAVTMSETMYKAVKQFHTIPDVDHDYFAYASDAIFMSYILSALHDIEGESNLFQRIFSNEIIGAVVIVLGLLLIALVTIYWFGCRDRSID